MHEDLVKELQDLKATLNHVQFRMTALEERLKGKVTPARPAAPSSTPQRIATSPKPRVSSNTLETTIGRYWLNRIGIVSLVLGVAFFILYTFQYFGPVAKIATGVAIAGALIGGGMWLERHKGWRWYALSLIGGGWALLYFTTFAMYHMPQVRLIHDPVIDFALLFMVAAGAVGHSLRYRSEVITALALALGFVTITLGQVTYFTLASSALLVGALAWIVVRMRWEGLFLYGVIASYATYLFWIGQQIEASRMMAVQVATVSEARFWLSAGFVTMYWVVYNAVLLALKPVRSGIHRTLITTTLINGLLFVYAVLSLMDPVFRESRHLFLLGVGAVYFLSHPVVEQRGFAVVAHVHVLMGLSFLTLAIPLKLTERWISFWWTMEVAFFAWLGLRLDRWPYRAFAMGLGLMTFLRLITLDVWNAHPITILAHQMPWRVVMGGVGVMAFGAAAAGYAMPQFAKRLRSYESEAFHLYAAAAAVIAWLLITMEVAIPWRAIWWASEAVGLIWLGVRLTDRVLRMMGAVTLLVLLGAVAVQPLMVGIGTGRGTYWELPVMSWVVAAFYGLSRVYRTQTFTPSFAIERHLGSAYTAAAAVVLTLLLWSEITHHWLSVAWAMEGLALVGLGFLQRDKTLRVSGLCVFALLILKILFVDLAGAETIYRVLSFIVAGALLLAASFAYTRFSKTAKP